MISTFIAGSAAAVCTLFGFISLALGFQKQLDALWSFLGFLGFLTLGYVAAVAAGL